MTIRNSEILLRRLTNIDFSSVISFINAEVKTVPPDFFFQPSALIIEKSLDSTLGVSHGAFEGEILIGVRLTYKPGLDKENHGYDLDYSDEKLEQVAQFHGTLIKNESRYKGVGNNLVHENCKEIFENSLSYILATVHPCNFASVNMLIRNGFEIKKEVSKYQNLPRLIFEKKNIDRRAIY